ncbi:DUF6642 family protein [Flavobacterium sp. TAB 87]|uniref:DUF6642 family protein n=1 Tax=Flavobacterium sp. TAB 87 TaxID=1729581 RepID=UPI00076D07EF|nr:DUF6642 family protein [Flavobacterium sp. TAB 87]KVV16103.1 hypothetical protein AP058_00404 [Flavobacterium sp. TAB 87]
MENETFIFCLEAVTDVEINTTTEVVNGLEKLAFAHGVSSIYKACDTIEGLEESLGALLYDDHNFKDYEIIYLVVPGQDNMICLHDYFYSLQEIAELFEGKLKGKIVHFSNIKVLDLASEEAQYFLDVTGARAISGYGISLPPKMTSMQLDFAFFRLCQEEEDLIDIVEELHQKHYEACKLLDFRLYHTP